MDKVDKVDVVDFVEAQGGAPWLGCAEVQGEVNNKNQVLLYSCQDCQNSLSLCKQYVGT